ncbi:selenophosphate synthase [Cnuella takakiae]|uniref:Selenide, water dikinase n=1 Tax=Cnuella takakiae TaxID=1302690 RepID=A0A1M4WYT0_9BACT|nr:selenide, water dikinase SelD [Cnuella takakiae]OLY91581.1 selenide, water dikinase SelD [Cnuella takakiae]SHE86416.1 selenophosphate synthase [Cnuella takakiae]
MPEQYNLTQYSHGGGCGCKIAPGVLEEILQSQFAFPDNKNLLVGNHSKDDAAVYDLGNGTAVISTTDFFMPIVNDAFDFGRIASANAISDVYAMGGRPIMAIAVLGWPVNTIPPSVAKQVIEGSRAICQEAGIPLAGGHSIDAPEPIFGLAVTGIVDIKNLKQNNTAQAGDYLFLTKKLGAGVLATAQKRGLISDAHFEQLVNQLARLNNIGEQLGALEGVHAMTDVTGFGLLGHLSEMAGGSGLSAQLHYSQVQQLDGLAQYLDQKVVPGATARNWANVQPKVGIAENLTDPHLVNILNDPQTNGGLLVAVAPDAVAAVQALLRANGCSAFTNPIGRMKEQGALLIEVGK